MKHELDILLGSVPISALLFTLITGALGIRRRASRRGLSWVEVLSQWWAWLRTELSAQSPPAGSRSGASSPHHSQKSRVWRASSVLVWAVAVLLMPYQAQPVSATQAAGYSEYYILGDEDDIFAALVEVNPVKTGPNRTQLPIRSRLSLVAIADDTDVYLDDDGDGYDLDPDNRSGTADRSWRLNKGEVLTLTEAEADGGDYLYVTGAPVSVVRIVWADTPGTYLSGSWALYAVRAWQSTYVVPVGEDLNPPAYPDPFEYTFLFIEAAEDNTRVVVTALDGTELANTVLNRGDNISLPDINAGTRVVATDATTGQPQGVQAGLLTSVNERWDSRYYTLTPEEFLCNEYFLPVPSMQFPPGQEGGRNIDTVAYIYAFQDNTVITIETATDPSQTITLPNAGDVYRYVMPRIPRGTTQGPYGARVTASDGKIWILVTGDDNGDDLDWGYQAMCSSQLGAEYYLPYAPANPAHITPLDDNTIFFVDWDSDGVVDETFTLNRFDTRMLYPPGPGYDATGAHIYATGRFAIAWGQDNTQRTPGEPLPDYDYGYTVLPLEPGLDPVLTLEKTADPTSFPCGGGTVQFTLVAAAGAYTVYNVDVSDVLPPGWRYVNGTTTITFSDGTPASNADPGGAPGPDLLWDLNHTLGPNQRIMVIFSAETIPGAYFAGLQDNLGQAYGEDAQGAVFRPEDHAFVFIPELPCLSLDKSSSAGGLFDPGDTITYTVVISNWGTAPATGVTLSDTLPANTTWADNVTIAPPSAGGTAGTPPIIASGMTVDAGSSVTVTFNVIVNAPLPAGVDTITNTACVTSAEISTPVCDTVTDRSREALSPAIEIAKTVYLGHDSGAGCPGSESVTDSIGAAVTYCFEVTSTGNTYLDDITIDDDDLGIDETQMTLLRGSTPLAPEASLVYYYEGTISGELVNTARIEGNPTNPDGDPLGLPKPTDADTAAVGPTPTPTPTPHDGEEDGTPPPTDKPTPISTLRPEVTPTPTPVIVVRLPETGDLPGCFTVVLGIPVLIGAVGLLSLALLEVRSRRGDGKGD